MARRRPKPELVVTAGQREQLESLANSRSLPAAFVMRRGSFDARQTRNKCQTCTSLRIQYG